MIVEHPNMREWIEGDWSADRIRELKSFLFGHGTLRFDSYQTGIFPAASLHASQSSSGYQNAWVRDNIYVALAHEVAGIVDVAHHTISTLATFFQSQQWRMDAIVSGQLDQKDVRNRPHVRFNAQSLEEIPGHWAHAQNDALGYFLWYYSHLANKQQLTPDIELLRSFTLYLNAINYWSDEDSGHWEEQRKVEASSIGAVLAGFRELREFLNSNSVFAKQFYQHGCTKDLVELLIERGEVALTSILPWESIAQGTSQPRRYDAALLFLAYPLNVLDDHVAQQIVSDVEQNLEGDYGIRRYLGDSYWTSDYTEKVPTELLTADVSEQQATRDALATPGEEAQWCIFDPIVSIIAGQRYMRGGDRSDLERQTQHLKRALGQLTGQHCMQGELMCAEAYYLRRGRYIPNDHVPLLWTQANLWMALLAMEESLGVTSTPTA